MRKILSVLATAVLVLQSLGTSLVYAQADANVGNEGGETTSTVGNSASNDGSNQSTTQDLASSGEGAASSGDEAGDGTTNGDDSDSGEVSADSWEMLDKDGNVVYNKWIELTDNIKLEDFYTEFGSIVIKDSEGNVKETITMDESKIERALYNAETNELATEDDIKAPGINKIIERVTYDNMYSHDIYHNIYTFVVVYYYDIDTREQIHDRQYIVPGYSFSYSEPDDSLPEQYYDPHNDTRKQVRDVTDRAQLDIEGYDIVQTQGNTSGAYSDLTGTHNVFVWYKLQEEEPEIVYPFTVTYHFVYQDGKGGTGEKLVSKTVNNENYVGKISLPYFTPKSFSLNGYDREYLGTFSGMSSIEVNGATAKPGDIYLYADYNVTKIPVMTMTFKYMNRQGEWETSSNSNNGSNWTVGQKKADNVIANYKTVQVGVVKYIFTGWDISFPYKFENITEDTEVVATAQYDREILVNFTLNYIDNIAHGGGSWGSVNGFEGLVHTFKTPADIPAHYEFLYRGSGDVETEYKSGDTFELDVDSLTEDTVVNVYAVYQPSITVECYDKDGKLFNTSESFTESLKVSEVCQAPNEEGLKFVKRLDKDGNEVEEGKLPAITTEKDTYVILKAYANYEPLEYRVTWNIHDGEYYSGATYHYQDNLIVPENPQGYEDGLIAYTFSGWTPELVNIVTGDAIYTAVYSEACITGYHYGQTEEGVKTCVSNEKEVETPEVCGELAKDSNAHYLTGTQTLTYIVDENGKGTWSDPICKAVCEDNYHESTAESTAGNDNEPVDVTIADGVKTNNVDGTAANETSENTESETPKVNNFRCEIDTFTVTFDSNGGSAVSGQTVEYGKTATKPADPTKSSNTFKGWFDNSELSGEIFNFVDTPITGDITLYAKWDKVSNGGGGGGGGSSSSSYKCENLPENAVANNTDKPNRNTDYSYSDDTSKVCTFQCKSGYTRDKDNKKCVKSENPGGGDGGEEEIELGGQVSDKCSVEGFNGSEEEKAAYLYACENDITTIRDINEARLKDFLTRAEMAKMVSVFATKELGMKPNTSKDCSNFANSIASYNQEMKDYMVMSCQLELMGIHTVNYEPIPDFMPSKRVSRAEFGTVLSRVLWGNKYEGTNSNYYINHLNALKENNIITNINPNITEYRAWVFLMLYRAVEAIKVLKSTNNVAIDQQVNEELQEEGKAETGLVVEYDSGSVVPDMATVTESGTLATGAVAKVESGNVAESQTGATTLTGEDASKEVSAETGAVAETGSTSD